MSKDPKVGKNDSILSEKEKPWHERQENWDILRGKLEAERMWHKKRQERAEAELSDANDELIIDYNIKPD